MTTNKELSLPLWRRGLTRNVVVLGFVSLLNDGASEMIYPLLPVFLTTVLGAGPAALGIIEGMAEATASLLKLYSGYLSDRVRKRKGWIVAGYSISNVIRPLIALSTSWLHVLVLRFSDRVGKGLRTSPRDAIIADSTPSEFRGKAYGFHRAMDHSGAIIGPLAATGLLALFQDDLKTVFLLSFIPGLLAIGMLLFGLKEQTPEGVRSVRPASFSPRSAWNEISATFRKYLVIMLIFTLGNSTDAFLLLRAQQLGVAVGLLPAIWVVLHIVKMGFSVPGGIFSDRVGRKKVIVTGWVVYALVYAGFAAAEQQWHAWALFAVYGVFFGLTEGVEKALVADIAPAHLRGSAFGLYHLIVGVGALPASLLFGLVWQKAGPAAAFSMGAGLAVVASLLLSLLALPKPLNN
ncbi:MAG: MFS transporter [Nitrospirae bacterium GWC2_57_9]|nr:MAG: MFS transporter [Nitrospirae bacterium GWC2_57_9]